MGKGRGLWGQGSWEGETRARRKRSRAAMGEVARGTWPDRCGWRKAAQRKNTGKCDIMDEKQPGEKLLEQMAWDGGLRCKCRLVPSKSIL